MRLSFVRGGTRNALIRRLAFLLAGAGAALMPMPVTGAAFAAPPTPAAPVVVTPANGSATSNPNPPITGTGDPGSTVTVYVDGAAAGSTTVDASGNWTVTLGANFADGAHAIFATATFGGLTSPNSNSITFTVDSVAPPAPVIASPANGALLSDNSPSVSGTAEPGTTVTLFANGAPAGTTTANASGNWSIIVPAASDGPLILTARASDAVGNASPVSAARTITIDTTAPAAPVITAPANGSTAGSAMPVISGTAEPSATVTVLIDGAPAGSVTADASGNWSFTVAAPLSTGAHGATARATDAAGNISPASAATAFTIAAAPTAANVSGVAVPYESGGTTIDLSGAISGVHTSVAITAGPQHGVANVAGDIVTYTPAAGYFGSDSFTYTATGPGGTSAPATVTLTVAAPAAPVAASVSGVAVAFGSNGTPIDLSGSISGVHNAIALATPPQHGTASVAGDVITYVPTPGYFGSDSFTYTATGPGGTSAPATVSLAVAAPPPPVATSGTKNVGGSSAGGAGTEIDLSGLISGTFTQVRIVTPPTHGTASVTGQGSATVLYTPNAAFLGSDSFTFEAVGPGGVSQAAVMAIEVTGAVPVALAKRAEARDGETVSIDLTAGATGGPFTAASIVSITPAASIEAKIVETGSGAARGFRLDVTPDRRFSGTATIVYTLTNGFGTSAPATATIVVIARPDPSADPNVRALSDAQAETSRRFARAQVANFLGRAEQLHGGGGTSRMGIALASRGARADRDPRDLTNLDSDANILPGRQPLAAENLRASAMEGRASALGGEAGGDGSRKTGEVALWSGGAIEIGTRDGARDRSKISAATSGLSGGIDVKLADGLVIGLGGGYGHDSSDIGGTAAHVSSQSSLIAVYASYAPPSGLFVDAMLGKGDLDFRTRRHVTENDSVARGERDGDFTVGGIAAGIDRISGKLRWSVYGRGEFLDADLGAYVETGAGLYDLRFDPRQLGSLTGSLGARFEYRQDFAGFAALPRLRIEWNHEFSDIDPQWLDYADIPGAAFYSIDGSGWRREPFQLSLGTRFLLPASWSLDIETGFRKAGSEDAGSLKLQVTKAF